MEASKFLVSNPQIWPYLEVWVILEGSSPKSKKIYEALKFLRRIKIWFGGRVEMLFYVKTPKKVCLEVGWRWPYTSKLIGLVMAYHFRLRDKLYLQQTVTVIR